MKGNVFTGKYLSTRAWVSLVPGLFWGWASLFPGSFGDGYVWKGGMSRDCALTPQDMGPGIQWDTFGKQAVRILLLCIVIECEKYECIMELLCVNTFLQKKSLNYYSRHCILCTDRHL